MVPIYLGLAIIIALVFAGFGITNFIQNRAHQQELAFDYATPSPAPTATPKPIPLEDAKPLGAAIGFPVPNPQKNIFEDTAKGGQGAPVDGIPCQAEMVQVHVHSHLAIFENGKQVQVPAFIGMAPTPQGGCLYWLHTHGPDGIIHVEAASAGNPSGGHYTLGNFFHIWGQPLSANQVGPFKGPVTAFVNGVAYDGDPNTIPMQSHKQIVLEIGKPVVPPPIYAFPAND